MPKITIIGSGNIGLSLAKGLIAKAYCNASDITLTRRNIRNMSQEAKLGFKLSDNNREAVLDANIIVLAVLPQQLNQVLEQINGAVIADKQLVVSVISGVSCRDIRHRSEERRVGKE